MIGWYSFRRDAKVGRGQAEVVSKLACEVGEELAG